MKVFIAGATGVLGRATTRQLVARGHAVTALVRSEDKAERALELGAEPVLGNMFDVDFLRGAVQGTDVIMHLATAIPRKDRLTRRDWAMNDHLRREGTRNLIEAARGEHLRAFIQQSIAFLYGDRRGDWVTEDEPPRPTFATQSAVDGEQMALAAYDEFGLPSVILRGATFYGPESWQTRRMISLVKRRGFPLLGSGEQYWHYIYIDDMARACVCAAENPAPGEIFFVADDWPFHARDFLNYLAAQLHAPPAVKMSVTLARFFGGDTITYLTQSVRFKTDKIKKMIGWTPQYPTYREGLSEILAQLGVRT